MKYNSDIVQSFRERYPDVYPLLFKRSVDYAKTPGELFDILEELPPIPIIWDSRVRRWVQVKGRKSIVLFDVFGLKMQRS